MKDSRKIIGALILGAAIGGLAGLLFAPGKGSETRQKVADGVKDLTEALNSQLIKLKDKTNHVKESSVSEKTGGIANIV